MDPTAQTNNPNPQGNSPKSLIEPGQFVVAGEDPKAQPQIQPQSIPPNQPPSPPQPRPGFSLAQDKNLAQSYPPPPPPPPPPQPPGPQPSNLPMQPDPAPFNGPQPAQFSPTGSPPQQGSKMKKLKLLMIVVALLALMGILGAVVWFFVLQKTPIQSVKTEDTQVQVEEPTPTPQVPIDGFGQLPQATESSEATGEGLIP